MEWLWPVFKSYIERDFARKGVDEPSDEALAEALFTTVGGCTVTILVQEPWQNSVRFKALARMEVRDATDLLADPMAYLAEQYGGGKFKLNFHEGWHFVATQNFKPDGPPLWKDLPEIELEWSVSLLCFFAVNSRDFSAADPRRQMRDSSWPARIERSSP